MSLDEQYQVVLWLMAIAGPLVLVVLLFVAAPYGRFSRAGWGPRIDNRIGWLLMEAPASLVVAWVMLFEMTTTVTSMVFLLLWQLHYFHRAFVYPFTLTSNRLMPISVVLMAVAFNCVNGFLISYHFVLNADQYTTDWFYTPLFIGGCCLYFAGFWITKRSDALLRALRGPGESGYRIPRGFLFERVSCPNYLGEIIQWSGWALLTVSGAGVVFLIWTLANLLPRALASHQWYKETFADYPRDRRALIPGLL